MVIRCLFPHITREVHAQPMQSWSELHGNWLLSFWTCLGVPNPDVYLSVFGVLCPKKFARVFRDWVSWLRVADDKSSGHIAFDGQTSRGSAYGTKPGLHTMNAWLMGAGFMLTEKGAHKKRGEIKAIRELLKKQDIRGTVVTMDAVGCQHAIAERIMEVGGDYFFISEG